MKFSENEIKERLEELHSAGWITENFKQKNNFIKDCINLDFTSPNKEDVFNAFNLFAPQETKILILGQDPYPDDNKYRIECYGKRAHGLAFSFWNSKKNMPEPADDSLENIYIAIAKYKEQQGKQGNNDIYTWNTNLEEWASVNKILLLNTALTYKKNEEHFSIWQPLVKQVIHNLIEITRDRKNKLTVFLWGSNARKIFFSAIGEKCRKSRQIMQDGTIRIYITGHPTPSYNIVHRFGFSKDAPEHFKACDKFLEKNIWKNFPENKQKI